MARPDVILVAQARLRTILEELELRPETIGALMMGWVVVWIICIRAHKPSAGIAATACWLAAVLAFHAWADLRNFRKRWDGGAYRARPLAYNRWWLALGTLFAGILFGYWVW